MLAAFLPFLAKGAVASAAAPAIQGFLSGGGAAKLPTVGSAMTGGTMQPGLGQSNLGALPSVGGTFDMRSGSAYQAPANTNQGALSGLMQSIGGNPQDADMIRQQSQQVGQQPMMDLGSPMGAYQAPQRYDYRRGAL